MQQRFEIYDQPKNAKKDADKLAADGWFVHAMTGTQVSIVVKTRPESRESNVLNDYHVCVVYRKKDKKE